MSTRAYNYFRTLHVYTSTEPEAVRDAVIEAIPKVIEIGDSGLIGNITFTKDKGLQFNVTRGVPSSGDLCFPDMGMLQNNMAFIVNEMIVHISKNNAYVNVSDVNHGGPVRRRVFDLAECRECVHYCKGFNIFATDDTSYLIRKLMGAKIVEVRGYKDW